MPIGKNALKRVENNGYSKVETSAPDMENSEVAEQEKVAQPVPAPDKAPAKKPAAKKTATKKPVSVAEEKLAEKKVATPQKSVVKKSAPKAKKAGKSLEPAVPLGTDLPFYLL